MDIDPPLADSAIPIMANVEPFDIAALNNAMGARGQATKALKWQFRAWHEKGFDMLHLAHYTGKTVAQQVKIVMDPLFFVFLNRKEYGKDDMRHGKPVFEDLCVNFNVLVYSCIGLQNTQQKTLVLETDQSNSEVSETEMLQIIQQLSHAPTE